MTGQPPNLVQVQVDEDGMVEVTKMFEGRMIGRLVLTPHEATALVARLMEAIPVMPIVAPVGVEINGIGGRVRECGHCGARVRVVGGRLAVHDRPSAIGGGHCRDSGRPV